MLCIALTAASQQPHRHIFPLMRTIEPISRIERAHLLNQRGGYFVRQILCFLEMTVPYQRVKSREICLHTDQITRDIKFIGRPQYRETLLLQRDENAIGISSEDVQVAGVIEHERFETPVLSYRVR